MNQISRDWKAKGEQRLHRSDIEGSKKEHTAMANNCRRGRSNLQSFLDSTTPSVPCHKLPKSCCRAVQEQLTGKDSVEEFFVLGDLWEQYYEWSAYGASVPVCLHDETTIIQYYVPYLSGVQIYTHKATAASRETSGNKSCSDGEYKTLAGLDAASQGFDLDHGNEWRTSEHARHLYFEFFESCSPYGRIPLLDKVLELAQTYPGLTSFKSTELSPASWMSVAWYPIYHIPTTPSVKELSVCFLTYHSLSSLFQDHIKGSMANDLGFTRAGKNGTKSEKKNHISLPPFGLATYKLQGSLWTSFESGDHERINSLFSAANSWLKQLKAQHHDFNFFTTHCMSMRCLPCW
uniref:Uncharacterized protein n=2 Tax=Musa acuminata subsp. malaccensis TaxID=214687 RepID=A0A804L875_MUSAM|nr:PREDICTED: uncharacterized protein LOC103971673 [Musa acuminata subsp. malaccensis]